ncbi:MAG: HEPN domain-containing protein, partial [Verrucomicrobiae bacterium]|nr:HEPN domain-containing protein [Verrucomicrobiae bacterium]
MSQEKNVREAQRWLAQAEADLNAARDSRFAKHFEWACFQAQQAGEKAMKALWFSHDADPWGHSVVKLIEEVPS